MNLLFSCVVFSNVNLIIFRMYTYTVCTVGRISRLGMKAVVYIKRKLKENVLTYSVRVTHFMVYTTGILFMIPFIFTYLHVLWH